MPVHRRYTIEAETRVRVTDEDGTPVGDFTIHHRGTADSDRSRITTNVIQTIEEVGELAEGYAELVERNERNRRL